MIPRIIHYCWFGGNPLPKSALKCINSWKKHFPNYEIKEWNESNYDVNKTEYTAQAYNAKKYAFVSDYARFDILFHFGGIYFDTDVEVIKPFDDILENGAFMGCEIDPCNSEKVNVDIAVNPGLGLAAAPGQPLYQDVLSFYSQEQFLNSNGTYNQETVVRKVTKVLLKRGLKNICGIQKVDNIFIYPKEFFNPLDDSTGVLKITDNTHSIHWYSKTWMSKKNKLRNKITRPIHRLFGENCFGFLKRK